MRAQPSSMGAIRIYARKAMKADDQFDVSCVTTLAAAVETLTCAHRHRDTYTSLHQDRVAEVAVAIGALMDLSASRLAVLEWAAHVHDIGKLGVPAEIIAKPGKLSQPEYTLVQAHCAIGHDILRCLRAPTPLAEIVFQHHERLDGSGYPRRLKGAEIVLEARILAVADAFDAMSSYRPYRAAISQDSVLEAMRQMAGRLLDTDAVEACMHYVLSNKAVHPAVESLILPVAGQDA